MQLAWGPCWKAGADYGLTAGARIALMAATGGALLLPFLVLTVALDTVWFLYGLFLAPYGLLMGLLGGTALAPSGTARPWPFLVRITAKRPTRRKADASAAALCMVR